MNLYYKKGDYLESAAERKQGCTSQRMATNTIVYGNQWDTSNPGSKVSNKWERTINACFIGSCCICTPLAVHVERKKQQQHKKAK